MENTMQLDVNWIYKKNHYVNPSNSLLHVPNGFTY